MLLIAFEDLRITFTSAGEVKVDNGVTISTTNPSYMMHLLSDYKVLHAMRNLFQKVLISLLCLVLPNMYLGDIVHLMRTGFWDKPSIFHKSFVVKGDKSKEREREKEIRIQVRIKCRIALRLPMQIYLRGKRQSKSEQHKAFEQPSRQTSYLVF